jgi:hypothetical protein
MIAPLRPALWRTGQLVPLIGPRATGFGARTMVVVSDFWGYPATGSPPPYENWPAWESLVRDLARRFKGQPVIFDIWNEPDQGIFWLGTTAQFRETFRRAERVLREELGGAALVAGPSFSTWNESAVRAFLDDCARQGTRVDVLALHEFQLDGTLDAIARNLRAARHLAGDRAYAPVGIREVQVPEVGAFGNWLQPGSVLASLYFLEQGGADAAARTCWGNDCWNNSLGGLLTPAGQPRAAWWAFRAYASTLAGRVPSSTNQDRLVAFAARGAAGAPARVVVATYEVLLTDAAAAVTLTLKHADQLLAPGSARRLRVRVQQVPDAGLEPVTELPVLSDTVVEVPAGTLSLELPATPLHSALVVTLLPE